LWGVGMLFIGCWYCGVLALFWLCGWLFSVGAGVGMVEKIGAVWGWKWGWGGNMQQGCGKKDSILFGG